MTRDDTEYHEKTLSLLRYALSKKGVSDLGYFIGKAGEERGVNDKLCLLQTSEGEWIVLYTERGDVSSKVTHPDIHAAAVDFFWKLTRPDTPWDYRAEWESKTGQYF